MVIHGCPSNSLFLMFHFFDACHERRHTFIPVLLNFHKECCPYVFQEEKVKH